MALDFCIEDSCPLVLKDELIMIQVIAQMTPAAIANTGWRIYLLFCIMLFFSVPFVYFFLPEVRSTPGYCFVQANHCGRPMARLWRKLTTFLQRFR